MICVLAGGVGAARYLQGLVQVVPPEEIVVVSNTGDDFRAYGAHVSPDIDIVVYTLAGAVDHERGWGLAGDTHRAMEELRALGGGWFTLGDRDLGVCLARARAFDAGETPSSFTRRLAERFGVRVRILPMTDEQVETRVTMDDGRDLHFQEYWVRDRAAGTVRGVRLAGAESARPAPGVLEAIETADAVLLAPSNPIVSIGTILSIPGVRAALRDTAAPVTGVSPIVGGAVVRGMADRLLPQAGVEVSAAGVAQLYEDVLDAWIVDEADAALVPQIEALGIRAAATQGMMRTPADAAALAKAALDLAAAVAGKRP